MNFADAIRQAAHNLGSAPLPNEQPVAHLAATEAAPTEIIHMDPEKLESEHEEVEEFGQEIAFDALTSESVPMPPAPSSTVATGNVVRLELFLSPEQLNALFRAVVATQHTVMTLREAAHYLRVPISTLETMAHEGQIPAFLVDGKWRFPRTAVDEWLNMQVFTKEAEA